MQFFPRDHARVAQVFVINIVEFIPTYLRWLRQDSLLHKNDGARAFVWCINKKCMSELL